MQRKVHRNKGPRGQKTLQKLHFQISRTGASGKGDVNHRHDDDDDDTHDGGDDKDKDKDDYGHFFSILETSGNTDRHHRLNNGSKGENIDDDNGRYDFYDYVYFSDLRMENE